MRVRRLQWYGHLQRREEDEDIRYVKEMKVAGRKKRGRPKRRWMDTINADLKRWGLESEDVNDRDRWQASIQLGSLQDGHLKRTGPYR